MTNFMNRGAQTAIRYQRYYLFSALHTYLRPAAIVRLETDIIGVIRVIRVAFYKFERRFRHPVFCRLSDSFGEREARVYFVRHDPFRPAIHLAGNANGRGFWYFRFGRDVSSGLSADRDFFDRHINATDKGLHLFDS